MQHRAFSPRRIAAIAGNTFTELTRLKVFYALLLFALVLIGSSLFMARLTFQQEFQVLKDVSLGAMSIFSSLLAVMAAARLLPQDVRIRRFTRFSRSRCRVSNTSPANCSAFCCCWW
jgi:hypothetical protein